MKKASLDVLKKIKSLLDKGKINSSKEIVYNKETCVIEKIKMWDEIIENI